MRFHIRQFLRLIVIKIQLGDFLPSHSTYSNSCQKAWSLNLLVACWHLLGPKKKWLFIQATRCHRSQR